MLFRSFSYDGPDNCKISFSLMQLPALVPHTHFRPADAVASFMPHRFSQSSPGTSQFDNQVVCRGICIYVGQYIINEWIMNDQRFNKRLAQHSETRRRIGLLKRLKNM